jgi:transposase
MIKAAIERCAGIDVGKQFLSVTIMIGPLTGEPREAKRRFGTIRAELVKLREWLQKEGITHVVMESTGSYGKPVFNELEDSVRVYVANPVEVKIRKGHKTDDKDGWWLAHLLRHAMIQPSFLPPRAVRELRDLTRYRKKLLGNGTAEKNRVHKILEDANVKLGNVLEDLFGGIGTVDAGRFVARRSNTATDRATCPTASQEQDTANYRVAGRSSDERSSPAHDPLPCGAYESTGNPAWQTGSGD